MRSGLSALFLACALGGAACSHGTEQLPPPDAGTTINETGDGRLPLVPTAATPQYLRSRMAGTLALSKDGKIAYVADADSDALAIVDLDSRWVDGRVKVGHGPSEVAVDDAGHVWVTSRGARSVSVIDPVAALELARITVGAEPGGLAITPDGSKVLVATRFGETLEVIDPATFQVIRRIPIPFDASHVVAPRNDRAFVTHARSGEVTVVDLAQETVVSSLSVEEPPVGDEEHRAADRPANPVPVPGTSVLFVPHSLEKADPTPTDVPDAYLGRTLHVPVVAYGLARIDADAMQVVSARGTCFGCGNASENGGADAMAKVSPAIQHARFHPMAGPVAAVTDGQGRFLFVANELSGNVSAFPTVWEPHDVFPVQVGSGPRGIAVSPTDDRLYVHAAFDHAIVVVRHRDAEAEHPEHLLEVIDTIPIGGDELEAKAARGRRLFHAADDRRLTDPMDGGIACASCHPEGRDDGRTWQFAEGPRNTPCLAGRHLGGSAPYHWAGDLEDPYAFRRIVHDRMGGMLDGINGAPSLVPEDFEAIFAWLDSLDGPDNPHAGDTSDSVLRGKALFEGRAGCALCHSGPARTDNAFHDVGTLVVENPAPGGHPDAFPKGIDTPPLFGLFATAPYLHDGSVPTLQDRVRRNPGDRHGFTSELTSDELDDLVAYLQTL